MSERNSTSLHISINDQFRKFAHWVSGITGSPWAFFFSLMAIALWIFSGPTFSFSDTWQLVINTGTTIITFLMVFLIQNTQNRDASSLHLKLDELIRAVKTARNTLLDIEGMTDEQLDLLQQEFQRLGHRGRLKSE